MYIFIFYELYLPLWGIKIILKILYQVTYSQRFCEMFHHEPSPLQSNNPGLNEPFCETSEQYPPLLLQMFHLVPSPKSPQLKSLSN